MTNINDIDLNLFPFDYDLTMAILLANPDGNVYHRYGGRTDVSPMNMSNLVELMHEGLQTHEQYLSNPSLHKKQKPFKLRELVEEKLSDKIQPTYGCYHCHYAREAKQYLALENRTWSADQFWIWPSPKRLGLVMDQEKQYQVKEVIPKSAANLAGFQSGDLLKTLAGKKILTKYDIQWILEQSDKDTMNLTFSLLRGSALIQGKLNLEKGWKVGDARDYRWRIRNVFTEHMVKFLPSPGFIGTKLSKSQLNSLGISRNSFALKVTQLSYGTYLAGIRLGDVILSAGGKSNFETLREFYHVCEVKRRSNQDIKMELMRQGSLMKVVIPLSYLNYSRIEKAPQVMLGFTAQELSGGGLRVGNIIDESNAEKTGLLLGDRIFSVEGEKVRTYEQLKIILNNKAPGDLFTLKVHRNNKLLQFAFVLTSEEKKQTNLAQLTENVTKKGQTLSCVVTIKLPKDKHIYSVHQPGFGLPTKLEFRGRGFQLKGTVKEPIPKRQEDEAGVMWILRGPVSLTQTIEVTDPKKFHLALSIYAQVCDDHSCHEFLAVVESNGKKEFSEFRGRFAQQPELGLVDGE